MMETVCSIDALRAAHVCLTAWNLYLYLSALLAPFALLLAIVAGVVSLLLFSRHSTMAIVTPVASLIEWIKSWRICQWLTKRRGERAMRKGRLEEQSKEIEAELKAFLESKIAAEVYTETEASYWYAKFSKHFPELRRWAFSRPTDLKQAIEERRSNQDRDDHGNIIPAPIPTGGA